MRCTRGLGLLSAALLVSALAGCSGSGSDVPVLTGARTVSVNSGVARSAKPKDMSTRSVHYRLVGPHYTLGLTWIATGQQLDATDAKNLGTGPVAAPQGQQLIIAGVDDEATTAAFVPTTPIPVVAVVNGVSTALSGLPLASRTIGSPDTRLIMVAAAPGATVQLRATDAGQAQVLDLRTGATSGTQFQQLTSRAIWQGQSSATLTGQGGAVTGTVSLGTQVANGPGQSTRATNATLGNYWEGAGWAAPGQELLAVPLPQVNLYCAGTGVLVCGLLSVDFDDSTALTFAAPGGQPVPARASARSVSLTLPMVNDTALSAVFPVPAATTGGTVTLDLAKSQLDGSSVPTAPWTVPPQPFTLPLAFHS
jgi:hypothetical protein